MIVLRTWTGAIRTTDRDEHLAHIDLARFYPEDDRYLVDRDLRVKHHDIVA